MQHNGFKRNIGPLGLMFSSVSAMIGSGWLFSAFIVAQLAGPAGILSWIIGSILVLLVAFTYVEVSSMLPLAGGSARFPQITHGTFTSLFFGWVTWINLMTAPATEVQALLQYAGNYWPWLLTEHSRMATSSFGLSALGYLSAAIMMLIFVVINIYSVRWLTRINNLLTIWKIAVPLIIGGVLIYYSYHAENFSNAAHGGFMPYGWKGVFSALATGGIIFAFNGFKQGVELAGEVKNPKKTVVVGIVGSLLLSLVIYLVLQYSFLGAMSPGDLSKGWSGLHFPGEAGPLAGILMGLGLTGWNVLLYSNAIVATSAAGLVYTTSASRTLYGLSANRQLPKFISDITKGGVPAKAIIVNFFLGMCFFLPFQGWEEMAKFMSSIIAISYVTGPVCCLCLRYQLKEHERGVRLPLIWVWSYFSFYVCNLVIFWTGWDTVSKLGIVIVVSLVVFFTYRRFSKRSQQVRMNWKESTWVWIYLIGLTLHSYLGSFGGGNGLMPFGWDFLVLAFFTLVVQHLSLMYRSSGHHVRITLERLEEEAKTGHPETIPVEH